MHHRHVSVAVTLSLALVACTSPNAGHRAPAMAHAAALHPPAPPTSAVDLQQFRSPRYGVAIDYPATLIAHRDFRHGYLANAAWKTFAGPDSTGQPVLELLLPKSNSITAGALRIGTSRAAREVRQCTTPARTARQPHLRQVRINGTTFTYFETGDAAMSHYLLVHSYRAVHAGRCYAIDLLVTGTRPQVYHPSVSPPFSHTQAFTDLQHALQGFHFLPAR